MGTAGWTLRRGKRCGVTTLVVLMGLTSAGAAQAAPGDLDTTFSGDGLVFTDAGRGDEQATALLRAADGSLIVAGQDATEEMFVARYTAAGSLDPTFGGGDGITRIVFPDHGRGSRAADLAFGPGGTIVVAGSAVRSGGNAVFAAEDGAVARLTSTGALDGTFSTDGLATLSFPGLSSSDAGVSAVAVTSGGAVAVAATVAGDDGDRIGVARLSPTGTPDSTFSSDGYVLLDFGPDSYDRAGGIGLQSDGKLLVAGDSDGQLATARLTTAGVPDTTYAGTGTALLAAEGAEDLVVQTDDKAVVAGGQSVARIGTGGTLDPSFAGDGTATLTTGGDDAWGALALGPNGTISLAGSDFGPTRLITVGRLTAAGVPDTTFSGDGLQTAALGDYPHADALAVDSAGTITVAGAADMGATGYDVALVRFTSSGPVDATWAAGGARTTNFGYGGDDSARSLRTVAAGKTLATLGRGAARYLAGGSLDSSYGDGGILTSPLSGPAAITPNGGLVIAGYAADDTLRMRRYTASGAPDATFGTAGVAPLSLPEETEDYRSLNALLVAADGSIVVTGYVGERVFAARYLTSGAKDNTFSNDGYAEATPIAGGSYFLATGAALQDNGKVLVTGYYNTSGARVIRFTKGGQLDTGFGTGGVADAGGQFPAAVTVDNAGRIIVAGTAASADFNDSAVARLTPTGARDTTFSGDGIASVNLGANDYFSGVTVDSRDRVVAAGTRGGELDGNEPIAGGPRPTIARFRVDGVLDSSFAGTGSTVVATGMRAEFRGVALDDDGAVIGAGEATPSDRFGPASDAVLARVLGGGEPDGDSAPPDTTFSDAPPTDTDDTTPSFTFAADGPATFECRVDAAEFAPCSSPHTTAALTTGAHTFDVRAIDASGNVDRTPAHAAFQVDTGGTAPDTTPPLIAIMTPSQSQHFPLGATVASNFNCTDAGGSGIATCTGPATVNTSSAGPRTFTVTATDVAGNSATKTVNYVVDRPRMSTGGSPVPPDTTGPTIVVPAGNPKLKVAANGRFPFSVGPFSEATTGTVALRSVPVSVRGGATAAAKKVVLKLGTKPFTAKAGEDVPVRFKLSKKHRKILTRLKQIRVRATIVARDMAGNAATKQASFRLTASKRKR